MRIFYFLSDFQDKYDLSIIGCKSEEQNDIAIHLLRAEIKMLKILDRFYEDAQRYRETGSFEIIWDDIIFDD